MLIIQAGTAPAVIRDACGDISSWFRLALAPVAGEVRVVRVFDGEPLPPPDPAVPAVITGSWAMVTNRHPWSEATAEWIRQAMAIEAPLLGVCYGHQLMAHALGGEVDYHPRGRELGCHTVTLADAARNDSLLGRLPPVFRAHLTHEQSVLRVPAGARVLASSAHDPHQILRYGPRALSTQFHPEFTPALLRACIARRADALHGEGLDPQAMMDAAEEAPHARAILLDFATQSRSAPAPTAAWDPGIPVAGMPVPAC
ncbi:GMP synthase [Bordetella genomosp. 1]|uniref:GMP synthase n=1 Tax=Bordetella genomosp. 1 TaxID=1395607 RepID=A0A261SDS0_9BORD|nr:glutamine amidotransferase [Bordetella genomosp. 1]OZI35558.1 GMP synthase [Bordetella genomosp. 1]